MPSLPASQLVDDGEADGAPASPAYDPSSEEPLPHKDGARKSVGPAPIGRNPNGRYVSYVGYENVGYVGYVMYTCMFRGTRFFRAAYPYPAVY